MRNILVFACILLFAFSACRKEKMFPNTTLSGIVKDSMNQQNLSGVKFELYRWKDVGVFIPTEKYIEIKSDITNNDGSWEVKFRPVGDRLYYYTFKKDGYYPIEECQYKENETPPAVIYMVPKNYIDVKVVSDTTNAYNGIEVRVHNPHTGGDFGFRACDEYLEDSYPLDVIANTYSKIEWILYPNYDCFGYDLTGGVTYTDSVWVGYNETVPYEIIL
jgi:hypothetical protein